MNYSKITQFVAMLVALLALVGCDTSTQSSEDLALLNQPARQVMVLSTDHVFELSSCAFTTQAPKYLNDAIRFVNNQPEDSQITIMARTDNVASDVDQLELTRSQAESIAAFLWAKGISRDRLLVKGSKPSKHYSDYGLTPEQLALNRRIEIIAQDLGAI